MNQKNIIMPVIDILIESACATIGIDILIEIASATYYIPCGDSTESLISIP
jgi:hypothetical protein